MTSKELYQIFDEAKLSVIEIEDLAAGILSDIAAHKYDKFKTTKSSYGLGGEVGDIGAVTIDVSYIPQNDDEVKKVYDQAIRNITDGL